MKAQFDDYDPRAWLERSGVLFLNHRCFAAAANAFSRLLGMEPMYTMGWYGLGNALFCISGKRQDISLLRDAVSSLKRAVQIEPTDKLAVEMLQKIPKLTPFSQDEIAGTPTWTTVPAELNEHIGFTDATFAESMLEIPAPPERMQIVMWLGMLDDECGKEILLQALSDSDPHVRMAALKRIDATEDDPRIEAKMQELAFSEDGEQSEPYLSMALGRLARASADPTHWAARILLAINKDNE